MRYVSLDGVHNVTGCDSDLLSTEYTTHIAGRTVEFSIHPLSFREYLDLYPGDRDERFGQFLRHGSLPSVDPSDRLRGMLNTILVEDVMSGMGKVDVATLRSLIEYLYRDVGGVVNTDAVASALRVCLA